MALEKLAEELWMEKRKVKRARVLLLDCGLEEKRSGLEIAEQVGLSASTVSQLAQRYAREDLAS